MLEQHEIGGLLGHVHRLIDRDAHVGGVQGGGVVDAVTHVAHHLTAFLQSQENAFFLVGIDLDEEIRSLDSLPQCLIVQIVHLGAGEYAAYLQPDGICRVQGYQAVIAGDDLERYAQVGQVGNDFLHAGLGRVEEEQEPQEGHIALVVAAVLGLRFRVSDCHPQHTESLPAPRLKALLYLGAMPVIQGDVRPTIPHRCTDLQNVIERALGDEPAAVTFSDNHTQPLAHKVVRDLVHLGDAVEARLDTSDDGLVQRVG